MTQSDRDVSAHKVNLNVIQAVPNHLDPSMCASPFIPDKAITPVNKYGACDYAADRWDIAEAPAVNVLATVLYRYLLAAEWSILSGPIISYQWHFS